MATFGWHWEPSTASRAIRSRLERILTRGYHTEPGRAVRGANRNDGDGRHDGSTEPATASAEAERGRSTASRVRTDGGRERTEADEVAIEFLDRETVRITGDLEAVMLSLCWWDEAGRLGTITEPVGGVDGERVVAATDAFADQEFAYGPIVTGVEGFADPGPTVPGTGDVSASNPNVDAAVEAVRNEYDGDGTLEAPFPGE